MEFDLERIVREGGEAKEFYLKLFTALFSEPMLSDSLSAIEQESKKLQMAMAEGLRVQALTSLESIATALWRGINDPMKRYVRAAVKEIYGIDADKVKDDSAERRKLLEVVYSESVTELLRLPFTLFCESRSM